MVQKHLHRFLLPAILLLLQCWSCQALSHGIGVSLISYTLDSSKNNRVEQGYSFIINAQLTNFDTVAFYGPIEFGLRNSIQTLTHEDDIFGRPQYGQGVRDISLSPHESVPAIFHVNINPQYFKPGPDVVVVWPISAAPVEDSILIHILIAVPLQVNEIGDKKNEEFSYAVMKDRILLLNPSTGINFKQVRIYSVTGQKISELRSDFITEIPVPALPKGIYLCELLAADGKSKVIKFFH